MRSLTLAVLFLASAAAAQPTVFTYQGLLSEAGTPANGVFDFRFRLFDAADGGNQIGGPSCADNVTVIDGFFTAPVDVGQLFATTDERWMRIQVRRDTGQDCAIPFDYIELAPLQRLTAAPIANHAKSSFGLDAPDGSAAVFVGAGGNVGVGTATPTFKLDVRGGPILVENLGDQADLFWLASERSWVFRQQGIGAGAALKLESVGGGGNKQLIFDTDGPVTIRSVSGDHHVPGGAESLRLIRGSVRSDGAILAGSGFTVNRLGTGDYFISFTVPFVSTPTLTSSSEYTSAFPPSVALPDAIIAASAHVVIKDAAGGFLADRDFHFIAIGPR